MSEIHLPKIKPVVLGKIAILLTLFAISVGNTRILIDNLLHSKEIDEKIVLEANPRLNRQLLQKATEVIDSFSSQELTSIFPSATLEQEAIPSGLLQEITIDIQNASGINGAASNLAKDLQQQGYKINTISTAPAKQKVTTIIYKPGKAEAVKAVEDILKSQNWPVEKVQEITEKIQSDIKIILGK